jgi:hypothetical protein
MADCTPGPWKAHFEEAYFVTGSDLGRVAMMMNLKGAHGLGGRRSGGESAANCRLIAAAPDLLDALQAIVKSLSDQDDEGLIEHAQQMIDARAAIAKATGEQS